MKITNANLIRLAGLSALLAGLCYVFVGIFHPANAPASVTTTRWEVVHVVACAMSFFGVLGLAGLYVRQAVKAGWLGLVGFVLLSLWMVVIMGFSFVEAFILPHFATATPSFIDAWMKMFNGGSSHVPPGSAPDVVDAVGAVVHRRRPAVRHRDLPRAHPATWRRRTPSRWNRSGSRGEPALTDVAAEGRHPDRSRSGLDGIRADDRTDNPSRATHQPTLHDCSMTAPSASAHRAVSRTAGILYVLTFVSIPTLALYRPVKGTNYILGSGSNTSAIVGGLLEITVALAGIGTAVVLFPILKKQNETFALGSRGRADPGVQHHLRRCGIPLVDRDLEAGRSGSRSAGHQPRPRRPLRPHLPARAELHASGLRCAARIHVVQVAPGAPTLVHDRHRRRTTARHRLSRRTFQLNRPTQRPRWAVRASGRRVRVLARCLADRQRIRCRCRRVA